MKTIIYFIFTLAIVFIAVGYVKSTQKCPPCKKRVVYINKNNDKIKKHYYTDNTHAIKHIFT